MTQVEIDAAVASLAIPFDSAGGNAFQELARGRYLLTGWTLANTSDANPTEGFIFDGVDTNGTRVAYLHAPLSGAMNFAAPYPGILLESGLTVQITAGTVRGSLYVVHLG